MNHFGFLPSVRSICTSSNSTSASPSSRPSRLQYGHIGVSGPGGAPASISASPYDSRAEPEARRGTPGAGGPAGSGISSDSSATETLPDSPSTARRSTGDAWLFGSTSASQSGLSSRSAASARNSTPASASMSAMDCEK